MASYLKTFTGDGSEVHFTADFPVLRLSDLAVVVNGSWLVLGVDYLVSGSTSGPLATLTTAPANGATVVLRSAVGYTPTDPAAVTTAAPNLNDTDTALWQAIGDRVAAEAAARGAADAAIIASGNEPANVSIAAVIGTGSTQARTVAAHFGDVANVKNFGATGDGSTDDTTAVQAALAAGNKVVFFPPGTYKVTSLGTVPGGVVIQGSGPLATKILRTSTSDFGSLSAWSSIYDITLDGNGATYATGKGLTCPANNAGQFMSHVVMDQWPAAALYFAADGGSSFCAVGCSFYTRGTLGSVAAVQVGGTDTQGIPRSFYGTASQGCTLFDFGGCSDFFVGGCYTNGLIFGAACSKVMINGIRIGAAGGTVTINGGDHLITGISAADVTVNCTASFINLQTANWAFTLGASNANNSIAQVNPPYAPTWTGTSSNPAIGNGTLVARYAREGSWVDGQIDLTIGSSTSVGSGTWEFSLPVPGITVGAVAICGQALITNAANTASYVGTVRIVPGSNVARIYYPATWAGNLGAVGATTPLTWATGDIVRLGFRYRAK